MIVFRGVVSFWKTHYNYVSSHQEGTPCFFGRFPGKFQHVRCTYITSALRIQTRKITSNIATQPSKNHQHKCTQNQTEKMKRHPIPFVFKPPCCVDKRLRLWGTLHQLGPYVLPTLSNLVDHPLGTVLSIQDVPQHGKQKTALPIPQGFANDNKHVNNKYAKSWSTNDLSTAILCSTFDLA